MYRVLLVDDESMARTGLRETFDWEKHGYRLVGEASNGSKAMKWIISGEVDILITDIAMPVMNGLELTRRTKELCPWVKVLLLSCHSDFEFVREGIRLGASDYILKPTLDSDALRHVLDQMRQRLEEERETQKILDEHRQLQALNKRKAAGNTSAEAPIEQEEAMVAMEGSALHERIVLQAIQYINARYTESISLQEVADQVSVSRNYFSELFKRVTGQNFIEYVIELRVKRAKELLATTSLRIYEVADQCGFNDVKYFSKLFKRVVGMTPAEFQGQKSQPLPNEPE